MKIKVERKKNEMQNRYILIKRTISEVNEANEVSPKEIYIHVRVCVASGDFGLLMLFSARS